MKKLVIIIGLILLICNFSAFALTKVVIEKINGGSNGYNKVREEHFVDDKTGISTHNLYCSDPGYTPCEWTNPPGLMRLVPYAESQIEQGNLNGEYSEVIDGILHIVRWHGTDIYSNTIEEEIHD